MRSESFAAQHKWDRVFFLGFILLGWGSIFMGFAGSVMARFAGNADYPAPMILVVHVFTFVGWMGLLTIQASLISLRRADIHRRMGLIGALLIPVMVISGVGAEIESQRFYSPKNPENLSFFIMPLTTMLMFSVFASTALFMRKDSPSHKRLILLATAVILSAAFNRWWGEAIYQTLGDEFFGTFVRNSLGSNILVFAAMVYDLATRGRIHRVYLAGALLIVSIQLVATVLYHSPAWPPIARMIVGT